MSNVTISGTNVVVELEGLDKLWALKSRFEIPFENIVRIEADPNIARGKKGFRAPGTHLPGRYTAGTFYRNGDRNFWNVRNPDNVVVVELRNERFARLIIEVAEPHATVALVERHIKAPVFTAQ